MKKTVLKILAASILISILIPGLNSKAFANDITGVVIINCGTKFVEVPGDPISILQPAGYEVKYSSSSAGAPIILVESDCSQAVADVLGAGFKLKRVKGNQSDDLIYILIKK